MGDIERTKSEGLVPFRRRYFKVGSILYPLGLLDGVEGKSVCGFCGQKIIIYSSSFVSPGEKPSNIFYGCRSNCGALPFYRVSFIDKKVFDFIVTKIKEFFPKPHSYDSAEILRILRGYDVIRSLIDEHHSLTLKLTRSVFGTEKILEEIKELESKIEKFKKDLSPKENTNPNDDPFFIPLWEIPKEKLDDLPLPYRRKVYSTFVAKLRFYDTYIMLRLSPIVPSIEKDFGKSLALQLNR